MRLHYQRTSQPHTAIAMLLSLRTRKHCWWLGSQRWGRPHIQACRGRWLMENLGAWILRDYGHTGWFLYGCVIHSFKLHAHSDEHWYTRVVMKTLQWSSLKSFSPPMQAWKFSASHIYRAVYMFPDTRTPLFRTSFSCTQSTWQAYIRIDASPDFPKRSVDSWTGIRTAVSRAQRYSFQLDLGWEFAQGPSRAMSPEYTSPTPPRML